MYWESVSYPGSIETPHDFADPKGTSSGCATRSTCVTRIGVRGDCARSNICVQELERATVTEEV